jgi:hypothetical protein
MIDKAASALISCSMPSGVMTMRLGMTTLIHLRARK